MISRLLYHGFWNIYDHLGALVLLTLVYLALAGLMGLGFAFLPPALLILLFFLITALVLAAVLPFGALAARGDVARIRHLLEGVKACWGRVLLLSVVVTGVLVLCYINLHIYLNMQKTAAGTGRIIVTVLAGLQGWMAFAGALMIWPLFCSATAQPGQRASLYACVREALVAVTLQPVLWVFVTLGLLLLLLLAAWSQFGLLFYLPLAAMIAQTAWFLTQQYRDFLTEARADMAGDITVRKLKDQAWDLALRWEAEQPRRTARELLRPWEM